MPPSGTRVTCSVSGCNQTFSRQSDCNRHEDEVHGEPKECTVPGCGWKKSKRKGRLEAHMKKEHKEIYDGVQLVVPDQWSYQQPTLPTYGTSQTGYTTSSSSASTVPAYNTTYGTTYDNQQYLQPVAGYYPPSQYGAQQYYQPSAAQPSTYAVENVQATSANASTAAVTSYTTADGQVYSTAGPSTDQYQNNYSWSSSG